MIINIKIILYIYQEIRTNISRLFMEYWVYNKNFFILILISDIGRMNFGWYRYSPVTIRLFLIFLVNILSFTANREKNHELCTKYVRIWKTVLKKKQFWKYNKTILKFQCFKNVFSILTCSMCIFVNFKTKHLNSNNLDSFDRLKIIFNKYMGRKNIFKCFSKA